MLDLRSPIIAALFFLLTNNCLAQQELVDRQVKKNIAGTTSAITFLTSQESVSTGIYHVGKEDQTKSQFVAFKLPVRHTYRMHDDLSQYSMLMGYGRFKMIQTYDLDEGKARSDWEAHSFSVGIGRSAQLYDIYRWFTTMEVAYTAVSHKYEIPKESLDNSLTRQRSSADNQFGNLNFNWQTDTLSFIPTIGLTLPFLPKLTSWHYEPKIMHVVTESVLTNKEIERVSSSSTVIDNKIHFGEIWNPEFTTWSLGISPYLVRTDLTGTINEGLKTDHWYKVGAGFKLHSKKEAWWDGLKYGISYVRSDNIRGGQFLLTLDLGTLLTSLI